MKWINKIWRACIPAVILGSSGGFATTGYAAPGLLAGTYRCSAYNVSGGGGSCRNMPPLALLADGSYRFSSTRGRWTVHSGKLALSESQIWGPGEILGGDAVRFEYDYRGWRHTVTWTCQECASATQGTANPSNGAYVGVSLTLQFAQQVGGVTGFTIVPVESARDYFHNAPLPNGAVQGLAWEAGPTVVGVATNRNNKLMSGRRYVVFLAWPSESIPVAIVEIPPTERDYTATLSATLDGAVLAQPDGRYAPIAPPGRSSYPGSEPSASYPSPPPEYPASGSSVSDPPGYTASPTPTYDPGDTVPGYGATLRGQGATPPPLPPKCHPHIPKYSQPGCVE